MLTPRSFPEPAGFDERTDSGGSEAGAGADPSGLDSYRRDLLGLDSTGAPASLFWHTHLHTPDL